MLKKSLDCLLGQPNGELFGFCTLQLQCKIVKSGCLLHQLRNRWQTKWNVDGGVVQFCRSLSKLTFKVLMFQKILMYSSAHPLLDHPIKHCNEHQNKIAVLPSLRMRSTWWGEQQRKSANYLTYLCLWLWSSIVLRCMVVVGSLMAMTWWSPILQLLPCVPRKHPLLWIREHQPQCPPLLLQKMPGYFKCSFKSCQILIWKKTSMHVVFPSTPRRSIMTASWSFLSIQRA